MSTNTCDQISKDQIEDTPPKHGIVHSKDAMLLRMSVGNATDPDDPKREYELSSTMNGEPIVQSKTTVKSYVLNWHSIIHIAVEAGVDQD
jgi:hypothetical protein